MRTRQAKQSRFPTGCTGFTLIEIMVVMSIIAILATLVVTGLARGKERARIEATNATITKILNALALYKEAYYAYPPSEGTYEGSKALYYYLGTKLNLTGGYDPTTGGTRQLEFGPAVPNGFLKTEVDNNAVIDAWGTSLTYKNPGEDHSDKNGTNNSDFVDIESFGPNQKDDPDGSAENDDINNWKTNK